MVWQDMVLFVTSFLFSYALLPQLYKGYKEKKGLIAVQTSLINMLALYAVSFAYYTLDLFFATVMTLITGTLWLGMFIQKIVYGR